MFKNMLFASSSAKKQQPEDLDTLVAQAADAVAAKESPKNNTTKDPPALMNEEDTNKPAVANRAAVQEADPVIILSENEEEEGTGTGLSLAGLDNIGAVVGKSSSSPTTPKHHYHRRTNNSDFSLQTTSSQESIDLQKLLLVTNSGSVQNAVKKDNDKPTINNSNPNTLSLHVSQVELDNLPPSSNNSSNNNSPTANNSNNQEEKDDNVDQTEEAVNESVDAATIAVDESRRRRPDNGNGRNRGGTEAYVVACMSLIFIATFAIMMVYTMYLAIKEHLDGTRQQDIRQKRAQKLCQPVLEQVAEQHHQVQDEMKAIKEMLQVAATPVMVPTMAPSMEEYNEPSPLPRTIYNTVVEHVYPSFTTAQENTGIATGIDNALDNFEKEMANVPTEVLMAFHDSIPEPTPFLEVIDDAKSTPSISNGEAYSFFVLPLLAIVLLTIKSKLSSTSKNSKTASAKHVSIKTEPNDDDKYYHNGVPALVEPTDYMNDYYGDNGLDLTMYESLHADELRNYLKERKLSTAGRKPTLIRRLVTSKQSELATLTVQELRPKLRGRGLGQGGHKIDLIRRLVEYGPK